MCWNYNQEEGFKPVLGEPLNYKEWSTVGSEGQLGIWEREFNENWGGGNWKKRFVGEVEEDIFTEDTPVTSETPVETPPPDEIGFGQGVVGGSSDPSLKRRQRGSKNRLRKLMRKDLKIPTGRGQVVVRSSS